MWWATVTYRRGDQVVAIWEGEVPGEQAGRPEWEKAVLGRASAALGPPGPGVERALEVRWRAASRKTLPDGP